MWLSNGSLMKKTVLSTKKLYLGVELGSTRIKCCLINENGNTISSGIYNWENEYIDGYWTYLLDEAIYGIGQCYLDMKNKFTLAYGFNITHLDGIGVSAMMHGLIALDNANRLLTPFRTWRNNNTIECAKELSDLLHFNIPARWSISHLYYSIKNKESFVPNIAKITTLASYIHQKLCGVSTIGTNDASGILPVDENGEYNQKFIDLINQKFLEHNCSLNLHSILPSISQVGTPCGVLSPEGATILDPEGDLLPGCPLCPPEGDAATGMISTNSIATRSANISAGTSIFGSFVLDKPLTAYHPEIDVVVTPDCKTVAMIHCNNGTGGINALIKLVDETLKAFGVWKDELEIYDTLFQSAINYKGDLKHMVSYNYVSGENLTDIKYGSLMLATSPEGNLTLGSVVLMQLFSSFITFSLGVDILKREGYSFENIFAHGGIFKTKVVAQKILASVLDQPVSINEAASEGGAWGMAVLALYLEHSKQMSLEEYLKTIIFNDYHIKTEKADEHFKHIFNQYKKNFLACLPAERKLGEELK